MHIKIEILTTGYCYGRENLAIRGGQNKEVKYQGLVALIQHPELGVILFDTGYGKYLFEETKSFPYSLYTWMLPTYHLEEDSVVSQLKKRGIHANEVSNILISHFHADHIAGLKDFPNAKIICNSDGYEQIKQLRGFNAVRKALIKGLLPEDFEKRALFYDKETNIDFETDTILGKKWNIFGDGSIMLVDLPGHAKGQYGILLNSSENEKYFLIADTCWYSQSFRENMLPSPLAYLIFDSISDFKDSLNKVHHYYKVNPDAHIIPTHCPQAFEKYCTPKEI